jgi:acetyltransferase
MKGSGLSAEALTARPARPADLPLLAALLEQVSDETRYLRYCHPRPGSRAWAWFEAERLVRQDGVGALTVIVTSNARQSPEVIAIGELVWSQGSAASGEVALMVRDDQQRQGVGTTLGRELLVLAQALGIATLHAHLLPENRASLHLLRRLGVTYSTTFDGELLHVETQANGAEAQLV